MNFIKKGLVYSLIMTGILIFSACTKHEIDVKPVEIKPIHITIDINIKVDKALDDFFGDLDNAQAE